MKILAFDPSGNYFEGKGTTGWAFYHQDKLTSLGQITSTLYSTRYEYWRAHLDLIKALEPDFVVIEDYVLYPQTAQAQIGSQFETPQLIGIIKFYCDENRIAWHKQHAKIKRRYSNKILLRKGVITQKTNNSRYYAIGIPLSEHIIDAIRHAEFFKQFELPKIIKAKEKAIERTS